MAFCLSLLEESDLTWFWNGAECQLGLSSLQGKLLERIREGRARDHNNVFEYKDETLQAMTRYRSIEKRLKKLEQKPSHKHHVATLHARYGQTAPLEVIRRFQNLHTIALPLPLLFLMAQRKRISERKLLSWACPVPGCAEMANQQIHELRVMAILELSRAGAAYAATKTCEDDLTEVET